MIAALFVETKGPYSDLPNVDPWDEARDARKYKGPHKVIAHPPCERWGKFARKWGRVAQDDGCFEAAVKAVQNFGGILEHPEGSMAFGLFSLPKPPARGWSDADKFGGRSCLIYQGKYGHRAPKPTWLYAKIAYYPATLRWGPTPQRDLSHLPEAERKRAIKTGICQRLSRKQRKVTPIEFRDLLIKLVENDGQTFPWGFKNERL